MKLEIEISDCAASAIEAVYGKPAQEYLQDTATAVGDGAKRTARERRCCEVGIRHDLTQFGLTEAEQDALIASRLEAKAAADAEAAATPKE